MSCSTLTILAVSATRLDLTRLDSPRQAKMDVNSAYRLRKDRCSLFIYLFNPCMHIAPACMAGRHSVGLANRPLITAMGGFIIRNQNMGGTQELLPPPQGNSIFCLQAGLPCTDLSQLAVLTVFNKR